MSLFVSVVISVLIKTTDLHVGEHTGFYCHSNNKSVKKTQIKKLEFKNDTCSRCLYFKSKIIFVFG